MLMREPSAPPASVVISGCGAVTRLYAIPALRRLADRGLLTVAAVYDPDRGAAESAGRALGTARIATSYADLLGGADLVLLAGPPGVRREQGGAAIADGVAVLAEKPLAATAADARRLVEEAAAAGVTLGTGLVRRQIPATRAMHWLISGRALGAIERVEWFEGGPFSWPVASRDYFSRSQFGGVLADIGTHVLDLAGWWFGELTVQDYEDDAMGGVEANCRIRLGAGGAVIEVRLSRDWGRPNRVVVTGQRGRIVWQTEDLATIAVELDGAADGQRLGLEAPPAPLDFVACYALQVEELLRLRRDGSPSPTAAAGAAVATVVERCRSQRRLMTMDWFSPRERRMAERLAGGAP
jgi:predicted dehydrogenase